MTIIYLLTIILLADNISVNHCKRGLKIRVPRLLHSKQLYYTQCTILYHLFLSDLLKTSQNLVLSRVYRKRPAVWNWLRVIYKYFRLCWNSLTLSWRRPLSYRNQSTEQNIQSKYLVVWKFLTEVPNLKEIVLICVITVKKVRDLLLTLLQVITILAYV